MMRRLQSEGCRRLGTRHGFTLIEMMFAIAIASVVLTALYSLFTLQSRQFIFQDLQMEMHQNQRFATDIVTRSVRMAGFGTSGRVDGYLGTGGDVDHDLPAIVSYDNWSGGNGTDAITVIYGDPSLTMGTDNSVVENCETTQLAFKTGILDYSSKLAEYSADEMVMCMDYAALSGMETYLWVLSADASGTGNMYVHDATSYLDYAGVCPVGDNLSPAMFCSKAQVMTFYVDNNDSDGVGPGSTNHPVLMLDMDLDYPEADDIPLVENVEDLQFEYCLLDADGDGAIDSCTGSSAVWVDTITAAEGSKVQMVRLHLLVRSSRDDPGGTYRNTRPNLANHTVSASADGYYRQILTTEVTVRNLRMQANL
ncbi:MAG: prepilin-type N-terminal cleavage/methylation domain-containing protein [Oligoflexia bacterium]|nr:prepilin-type N-terminal cleavage/methylation domain-containing protein [Oligoflexia bacterium]